MPVDTAALTLANIKRTLREVASEFNEEGRRTILYENFGKHSHELQEITAEIAASGARNILDVGGGDGVNLIVLHRLMPSIETHLVDNFVMQGENRMGTGLVRPFRITAEAMDVKSYDFWVNRSLPYENESFDIVTLYDVMEHLPSNSLYLLAEIRRILRPGGALLLGGPNAIALMRRLDLGLLGQHPYMPFDRWTSPGYVSHYREYTPREYRQLAKMSGFTIERSSLVLEPTASRARNRYHDRLHSWLSPVTWALWGLYIIEKLIPPLRPVVMIRARKPS